MICVSFICVELHFLGCKVPFPLNQSWKRCSWGLSRARNRVRVQSFHFMVELTQHQASSSPSVHCVCVHMALVPVSECRVWEHCKPGVRPSSKSRREYKGGTSFFQELMYLRFPTLSVATPILANDLLLSVVESQLSFLNHPDFTGNAYNIWFSLCFFPVN